MNKIAVILSGNGVYDGAEINEVVLTLLAIEQKGFVYECFAPNKAQHHVINHITGAEMPESRNMLIEAARIVRGKISALTECKADDYSALIVPGGFGVAKNLSNLAFDNEVALLPEFLSVCIDFKKKNKPVGYMCIAPVLLPVIYGKGVTLTIGRDLDMANRVNNSGGIHQNTTVDGIVIDKVNKIISTPAYMLANNISEAKVGIDKLVDAVVRMI